MTDQEILDIAHRTATVYRHRSDPDSPSYGFVNHTVIDFGRKVERAVRAELAKPVEQAEPVAWLYSVPGHRSAASCERIPLDMTPRGTAEAPLYLHPPTPAWHDAPTCAGLWLCNYGILEVVCINQPDVDNFDDFYNAGGRWYGPIPQDKEGNAT